MLITMLQGPLFITANEYTPTLKRNDKDVQWCQKYGATVCSDARYLLCYFLVFPTVWPSLFVPRWPAQPNASLIRRKPLPCIIIAE